SVSVRFKEGLHRGAGVILCTVLHEHQMVVGLLQNAFEKGRIAIRIEPAFPALIKQASGEGVDQAENLVALAHARSRDQWLSATPSPGVAERAPLREARLVAKPQQGNLLARQTQNLGPRVAAPFASLGFVPMVGDEAGLLPREAESPEQLRNVKGVGEDAKPFKDQLLNHRRAPASAVEAGLDRAFVDQLGEFFFLRPGQLTGTAGRLFTRRSLRTVAHKQPHPFGDRLELHSQSESNLFKALAIHHSEDGQEIFDLVQVAQLLGGFQSLLDFFAVMGCDSKTKAAHQDVPPDGNESPFGGAFLMCRLSSTHFQKIFFSRSIVIYFLHDRSVDAAARRLRRGSQVSVRHPLAVLGATCRTDRGGTFEKSEPSPSAIVGCARMASRSLQYGRFDGIAVRTAAMTSPASAPIIVKPRMRSSLPTTRAFMKPCLSPVACARSTTFVGSFATRTVTPWRCASPSVSPTCASGGSVNMQYGTS